MDVINKGYIEKYSGNAIVCFLDVLGFSRDVYENWDKEKNNPLDKLLNIKKIILEPDNSNGLTLKMDKLKEINYLCDIKTVSDSIIISHVIAKDSTIADVFFGMNSTIVNIAKVWGVALESGYSIRGGVDFGKVYWDKNEIIGPSFINAYNLENNVAKSSRVVFSDDFAMNLYKVTTKIGHASEMLFKMLSIDKDGQLVLNPNSIYDDTEGRDYYLNIIQNLKKNQNEYIRKKYDDIENYLSSNEEMSKITNTQLKEYLRKF